MSVFVHETPSYVIIAVGKHRLKSLCAGTEPKPSTRALLCSLTVRVSTKQKHSSNWFFSEHVLFMMLVGAEIIVNSRCGCSAPLLAAVIVPMSFSRLCLGVPCSFSLLPFLRLGAAMA